MTDLIEVRIEDVDSVAIVTLNRPDKRNALDDGMREALLAELSALANDRRVRSIILTGNGKAFCAGGDIAAMQERAKAPAGELAFNGWSRQQRTHAVLDYLHQLPKPVIAAVNGAAAGLGADMALSCDFVVASEQASFTWSYVLRGLIPDGGGMYFLPRRVGLAQAKRLIFSGKTIDAATAQQIGVTDLVVAPSSLLDSARGLAREFAQGSASAIALTKTTMNRTFEMSPEAVFAQGSQAQAMCYTTAEHKQAIAAFLNKAKAGA